MAISPEKKKRERSYLSALEYGTGSPRSVARGLMGVPFSGAGFSSLGTYMPQLTGMGSPFAGTYLPSGQHHIDARTGKTIPFSAPENVPYQAQLEQNRLDAIQPVSPTAGKYAYEPETYSTRRILAEAEGFVPGPMGDFVPKYQDVNPFIWNPMTGEKDRSYFDEYINLLTARHPNFAAEYAANPHEALQRYEGSSGMYGNLGVAHDYYSGMFDNGSHPVGILGLTPEMIDDPSGMDAATLARTGGILQDQNPFFPGGMNGILGNA